ncbi:hypothetical protein Btru_000937 [Bulinus truncatus]|nr:hypothetical protein Btru_000937 [Bulinus truncatus]
MASISGHHISITPEDIVTVKADVIVSSIHQSKNLSKGKLSDHISKIGGPLISKDLVSIPEKELALGQIVRTSPGKLAAKCVLFVCLSRWSEGNEEKLQESIYECLKMASELGYKSIAFPALGTSLGYTPFISAMSILTSIIHFFCDQGDSSLETVNICLRKNDDAKLTQAFIDTCCSVFLYLQEDDKDNQVQMTGVETSETSPGSATSLGASASVPSSPSSVGTSTVNSGSATFGGTSSNARGPSVGVTSTNPRGPSANNNIGGATWMTQAVSLVSKFVPWKSTGIKLGGPNSPVYLTIQPGFNINNQTLYIRGEIQLSIPKFLIAVKTLFVNITSISLGIKEFSMTLEPRGLTAVAVKDKLEVNCTLLSRNSLINPKWQIPKTANITIREQKKKRNDGHYVITSVVHTSNFQASDAGTYKCHVDQLKAEVNIHPVLAERLDAEFRYGMPIVALSCKVTHLDEILISFVGWFHGATKRKVTEPQFQVYVGGKVNGSAFSLLTIDKPSSLGDALYSTAGTGSGDASYSTAGTGLGDDPHRTVLNTLEKTSSSNYKYS